MGEGTREEKPTGLSDDETTEAKEDGDDSASVLFFGKHLKDFATSSEKIEISPTKERLDSPSELFFGESLEEATKAPDEPSSEE